ncbi:hypothetical protein B9479_006576 [Cryptococcus floricola]|uniref:Uncharacterized protein n=1 Tax=Cryptococcus floricola TaxID=2591691 RepID=A0A5D3ARQ0_9TREE|nr:hypothetical protein B9479_006576 [Cryptococcus floricola]
MRRRPFFSSAMYRRPNPKEARLKEALESVWPDYVIPGRKPEPFPLPTFTIISLDALYPVHPEILDILFFSSPKTEDSRVLNHLQHTVSVRIGSFESIKALESVFFRLLNGDVFRKVTQVEFTASTFKRCWTSGTLSQMDVGSIEDCLGDSLEELIIRIERISSKQFALYQAGFTQLLGNLPPLVTMILSLPNPHAPSWVSFLERFPELLRHWTSPQCLRIVFKIPEQMTSLVKDGVENAIARHIRTRAIDTAREPTGGAGGNRVEYHFSGAEEMGSRISAKFTGDSILNQQILKDFKQKKYQLVELPPHAFSWRKDGTDMVKRV